MERMFPQMTSPTEFLVSPFGQEEPQDSERKLHEFDMDFMNSVSATTNYGGLQDAPDSELSMTQWLPEPFTDYVYTDCCDGCQIEDPGNAICNRPPIYQDVPRIVLDQADRVRPLMETDGHLMDQTPVSGEDAPQPTSNPNTLVQDSNLMPIHPGWGMNHQANGFHNHFAHRPKPDDIIADSRDLLRSNGSNLGRRKSVPHHRLRKLSSVDQGTNHVPMFQERTQTAGIQVFDTNMKIKPGRKKRRFSEGEKERIGRVRKVGACSECRLKKRRCDHALAATPASSPGDESNGPITPAPEEPLDARAFSAKEDLELDLSFGQIPFLEDSGSLDFLTSPLCPSSFMGI